MAAKDDDNLEGPSLELPSFGFGRKKRKGAAPETAAEPVEQSEVSDEVADDEPVVEAPAAEMPAEGPAERDAAEQEAAEPDADEEPTVVLSPAAAGAVETPAASPEPEAPIAAAPDEATDEEPTVVLDAPFPGAATAAAAVGGGGFPIRDDAADTEGLDEPAAPGSPAASDDEDRAAIWAPLMKLPTLPGRQAAAVTGAVIGLIAVLATFASLQACGAVRGTQSCGGAGFLLLVAILVALVFIGAALLKAFEQPDSFSTSFLAVGLLAVIALLFFAEVLTSWGMVIVIPIVAALTYLLSHWVTTALIEPAREEHETLQDDTAS